MCIYVVVYTYVDTLLQRMYTFTSNFTHLWIYSLINACCCMYSLELLMMDGKTVRNM